MRIISMVAVVISALANSAYASQLSYSDFSNTANIDLNGSAVVVQDGANKSIRLTPAAPNQAGSAFTTQLVDVGSFTTNFQFHISNNGSFKGDGLTFEIQAISPTFVGGQGGGIGSGGSPSVVVEFDDHQNNEFQDAPETHLGIDFNGNMVSVATAVTPTRFDDGNIWYAKIGYDGSTLSVWANETGTFSNTPMLSYPLNIGQMLGQTTAYVGFTSGTGAGYADHDIQSWTFNSSPTPEPSSLAVATLMMGLLLRRRPFAR